MGTSPANKQLVSKRNYGFAVEALSPLQRGKHIRSIIQRAGFDDGKREFARRSEIDNLLKIFGLKIGEDYLARSE